MNGPRQTTASLKDQIESAADRRDIQLDAIKTLNDGEQRTFRVLETDGESEADQVGFQITHPGGPTGDDMFRRHLNNAMDQLRDHVNGDFDPEEEAEPTVDDETTEADVAENDVEDDPADTESDAVEETTEEDLDLSEPRHVPSKTSAEITVSFDDDQLEEIREMFDETTEEITASHEDLDERLDSLDERISRLEEALSGLAQVSADE